jgi:hypothetical protein
MTTKATFSCRIGTTDPSAQLGMEVWLDNEKIFDQDHVKETQQITSEFLDDNADHSIKFVLKNKTDQHTKINESGEIISDACLTVDSPAFDDIELGHMFVEQTVYEHNFNGTQPTTQQGFYGVIGCNGIVTMEFSTPIYLWLLENM